MTTNQERKILKILKLIENIYFDTKNISKFKKCVYNNLNKGIYTTMKNYEIANNIYDIIQKTISDKHITFSPNIPKNKYDKSYFNNWIYTKKISNTIGYIKFNEFPDYGLNKLLRQMNFDDLSKTRGRYVCDAIVHSLEHIKQCKNIIFDMTENRGGVNKSLN